MMLLPTLEGYVHSMDAAAGTVAADRNTMADTTPGILLNFLKRYEIL
ncbi:MAG TPA: hypothetical protein VIL60_06050 [Rhodanobacter sp.]